MLWRRDLYEAVGSLSTADLYDLLGKGYFRRPASNLAPLSGGVIAIPIWRGDRYYVGSNAVATEGQKVALAMVTTEILLAVVGPVGSLEGRAVMVGARGGGGDLTRVGRWMSMKEFRQMSDAGRVIEGAGGRTYVIRPPNPGSYTSARPGSVYAEFDVPSNVLKPASKPDWAVIPGPNVTTRIYGPPPAEMPPATCIACVIGQ